MPEEISIEILYINIQDIRDFGPEIISKQARADLLFPGFTDTAVRCRHMVGSRLASALFKRMGLPVITSEPLTSAFGKPYIPSLPAFNISHSGDIVICATACYGEIGIDIESIRSLDWRQYRDCFSVPEWSRIARAYDPCESLLELWTQKESLLKADGRGLQIPMASVKLLGNYGVIENEVKKWYLTPVSIAGYFCHVSTEYPVQHVLIQKPENFPDP